MYGFDLSADLMHWARRGVFMHTIKHPSPSCSSTSPAGRRSASGSRSGHRLRELLFDIFSTEPSDLPGYPPIGAHYGAPGSYTSGSS